MTIAELCEKYNVSESSVKTAFPRTQKALLKKYGVRIIKEGRGAAAEYYEQWEDDGRADSIYEEVKDDIIIDNESFKLMDWDFLVFLAIIITPMRVFRGTYEDLLRYIEIKVTPYNLNLVKYALNDLKSKGFINYEVDMSTNENYIVAYIYRKIEHQMHIDKGMVTTCKLLGEKYHKRSWVPLLKTWLGVQMMEERQPYTISDLQKVTGLSEYQIRTSNNILRECQVYRTSRAYNCYCRCVGVHVDLNVPAFYLTK